VCRKAPYIHRSTNNPAKIFFKNGSCLFLHPAIVKLANSSFVAEVAHLVEHDLAKVGVAGSSPVFRSGSRLLRDFFCLLFILFVRPGGGTGRHAGLKILSAAMRVRVQLPPGAPELVLKGRFSDLLFFERKLLTYPLYTAMKFASAGTIPNTGQSNEIHLFIIPLNACQCGNMRPCPVLIAYV
jgi:hypothetical protein